MGVSLESNPWDRRLVECSTTLARESFRTLGSPSSPCTGIIGVRSALGLLCVVDQDLTVSLTAMDSDNCRVNRH